jgi:hypothetical protein
MSTDENPVEVKYPMRNKEEVSKWKDPEFRKEWNRQYRKELREGKRQATSRSDQPTKWQDPLFRRAYDQARSKKLIQDKTDKKMSLDDVGDKRPNYSQKQKEEILNRMLDMVREGKQPTHPYFQLALAVKKEFVRKYPNSKTQKNSS